MASYNASDYIAESIDGILGQTLSNFELIIVDDASTDRTGEIIEGYAIKDPRIIIYKQKVNTGPAIARNVGISMAKGKWIAINDADDISLPKRLEKQLDYVERNPEVVMIGSGFITIDAEGNVLKKHKYPDSHIKLVKRLERRRAFFPHSSCLFYKPTLEKIGGFNMRFRYSQDADLWFRFSEIGKIGCISQPLVKIRKYQGGVSEHEGGKKQLLYGIAAGVCHFLRKNGERDPSSCSQEEWTEFIEWISFRLEKNRIFKRQKAWNQARKEYLKADNKVIGAFRLIRSFAKHNYLQNLYEKIFGSDLLSRLADEWVEKRTV